MLPSLVVEWLLTRLVLDRNNYKKKIFSLKNNLNFLPINMLTTLCSDITRNTAPGSGVPIGLFE